MGPSKTIEKIGEYKGYKFCILRMPMGWLNGYIQIPETSRFYNRDYNDISLYCIDLTYSDYLKELDNKYCIGWDHMGDLYSMSDKTTVEEVEEECHEVIDSLIRLNV